MLISEDEPWAEDIAPMPEEMSASAHPASGFGLSRSTSHKGGTMLELAVLLLVIALIAAFFGFGGVAGTAAVMAKWVFGIFLILAILAFFF